MCAPHTEPAHTSVVLTHLPHASSRQTPPGKPCPPKCITCGRLAEHNATWLGVAKYASNRTARLESTIALLSTRSSASTASSSEGDPFCNTSGDEKSPRISNSRTDAELRHNRAINTRNTGMLLAWRRTVSMPVRQERVPLRCHHHYGQVRLLRAPREALLPAGATRPSDARRS